MYIARTIESLIKARLFQGKIILVSGARQVGKTTLVQKIAKDTKSPHLYLNCDESDVMQKLGAASTSTQLKQLIGEHRLTIIDEAQRIPDIGLRLKLMIDNFPRQQIIATGSSSLDLTGKTQEALTGRNFEFFLYPLSVTELSKNTSSLEMQRQLEQYLLFGMYPDIINAGSTMKKQERIKTLTQNYLYKDVLTLSELKKSETLTKILQALALQIGSEVSYNELGNLVGTSKQLVSKYIEILEKVYIVFHLSPFSRNLRKELSKNRKIYFYDTGVRNAIINQFNPLSLRDDTGRLWENFVIAERFKNNLSLAHLTNRYFWRTYDQQEIDLIEETAGKLEATEIKWRKTVAKPPTAWKKTYPGSSWETISPQNFF